MTSSLVPDDPATIGAEDDGTSAPVEPSDRPSSSAYARVAALLHESRRQAPDQVGSFLAGRVADFGMGDLSVYVTDFEQRRLVPIVGSAATGSIDMDDSTGGQSFTTAAQLVEPAPGGERLWSLVVDGAARLGVMCVTMPIVDDDARALADSLAGVIAALLVTRGQCTDAYTTLRRTEKFSLAAEMQWDLLPPLSLDSGRVSVAWGAQRRHHRLPGRPALTTSTCSSRGSRSGRILLRQPSGPRSGQALCSPCFDRAITAT